MNYNVIPDLKKYKRRIKYFYFTEMQFFNCIQNNYLEILKHCNVCWYGVSKITQD